MRQPNIIQIILAINFIFPYFRPCMGGYKNVFCWVHSCSWTDHTWYNEEAQNHGHWEGSPWFSEQVNAVHMKSSLVSTFLFYVLEYSEHYLLPLFPGCCGLPSPECSNHLLFLYLHFGNFNQQAVTRVFIWSLNTWLHSAMISCWILNFVLIFPEVYFLTLLLVWRLKQLWLNQRNEE